MSSDVTSEASEAVARGAARAAALFAAANPEATATVSNDQP